MRPVTDMASTIRWFPAGPSRTVCLLRAVLLSGVVAVVCQAALTLVVELTRSTLPMPTAVNVHLTVFLLCLPWIYRQLQRHADDLGGRRETITCIDWSTDRITALSAQGSTRLAVVQVNRYPGALDLTLRELDDRSVTHRITVWCAQVGKESFRSLVVLVAWHAGGWR